MNRTSCTVLAIAGLAVSVQSQIIGRAVIAPDAVDPSDTIDTVEFQGSGPLTIVNAFPLFFAYSNDTFSTSLTLDVADGTQDQVAILYDAATDTFDVVAREGVTPLDAMGSGAALVIGIGTPTVNDHDQFVFFGTPIDLGGADTALITSRVMVGTPNANGVIEMVTTFIKQDDGVNGLGLAGPPDFSSAYPLNRLENDGQLSYFDDAFFSDDFAGTETDDAIFTNVDLTTATPAPDDPSFNDFTGANVVGREDVPSATEIDPVTGFDRAINSIFEYAADSTGDQWIYDGDFADASDNDDIIVTHDGVIAQEDAVFNGPAQLAAGLSDADTVDSVDDPDMNASGAFAFLAAFNADAGAEWVVYDRNNGSLPQLVVKEGQPISPFVTGENWLAIDDVQVNASGDIIVFGQTDNPDPTLDHVMVYNNYLVVARESNAVRLSPTDPNTFGFLAEPAGNNPGGLANGVDAVFLRLELFDAPGGNDLAPGNASTIVRIDFSPADVNASGIADFVDVVEAQNTFGQFDFNFDGAPGQAADLNSFINEF